MHKNKITTGTTFVVERDEDSLDLRASNGADVWSVGFGFWPIRKHDSDRGWGGGGVWSSHNFHQWTVCYSQTRLHIFVHTYCSEIKWVCYLYDVIIIIIITKNSSYSLPGLTAYQGQHINGSYINRKPGITHKFSTRDSSKLNKISCRVGIKTSITA